MKQQEKRNEALLKKILSGRIPPEKRLKFSKDAAAERLMKLQWNEGCNEAEDEEIRKRIWKQVVTHCSPEDKKGQKRARTIWSWRAACAAIIVLIGSTWLVLENKGMPDEEYQTVYAAGHKMTTLPDRSKVWMQPGSSLRYDAEEFNRSRKVWLKGDATFEVMKRTESPFRVYVNEAFVEVKGTTFRIAERSLDRGEIFLFDGRVNFHPSGNGKIVEMRPDQCVTYQADGKTRLEEISHITWLNGQYRFSDIRLDSLISAVNKLYEINVELAQDVPRQYLFSGIIRYDELSSEVIQKICYNMNLKYKQEKGKGMIYKLNK